MFARMDRISGLTDAFFIIMKGIFTPDLGDQKNIKIIEFEQDSRRGFIAYNFTPQANYFDCDIIDRQGNFLKAYISDRSAKLSLDNMLGIISTFE
jgi:hypothetical protein